MGFHLIEAHYVASAPTAISDPPDIELACADVRMSDEGNGTDLAGHVLERYPQMKVIMMLGFDKNPALPPGISVLAKPFRSAQLVELAQSIPRCG